MEAGPPARRLTSTVSSMSGCTAGRLVLALVVAWFVIGAAFPIRGAQDAIPMVVAGELVLESPEVVYVDGETGGIFDPKPEFRDRTCEVMGSSLDCEGYAVSFLSLPGALSVMAALSLLGPDLAILAIRLLALSCTAVGVVVLWDRLSRVGPRATDALALAALLATPLVLIPIDLGQTSTLLFLSTVLGTSAASGGAALGRGAVWAGGVLAKASPLALAVVLAVQRRWAILGWGAAVLVVTHVAAVAIGGWDLFGWFVEGTSAVSGEATTNPYNGAFEAALLRAPGVDLSIGWAERGGWALRVLAGALAAVGFFRLGDRDVQWAFAWAVLVALLPVTWWHYSIVSFGALAVALAASRRAERYLWVLPAFVAVGLPVSIANSRGWSMPTVQALLAVGAAVGVYLVGRSAGAPRADGVDELARSAHPPAGT